MPETAMHQRLVDGIMNAAERDGVTSSLADSVTLFRASQPRERQPVLYDPQFVFAAQGSKHIYAGGRVFRYDAQQMLVLSVPLPIEGEITEASPDSPYLAVKIAIQPQTVAELLAQIGPLGRQRQPSPGIHIAAIDDVLLEAVVRLIDATQTRETASVLAPAIVREIHYRVLRGPQGLALRALVQGQRHKRQIAQVLTKIHGAIQREWDVASMASEAHMSPSTFHRHFKAVTSMSPLNYLKSLRLHCARSFMLHDGANAGEAAYRVGYSSTSQFSREFKRLFGRPPSQDVNINRDQGVFLPWPPALLSPGDPLSS